MITTIEVVGNLESTYMVGGITNGQCNQCHGVSTEKNLD